MSIEDWEPPKIKEFIIDSMKIVKIVNLLKTN